MEVKRQAGVYYLCNSCISRLRPTDKAQMTSLIKISEVCF